MKLKLTVVAASLVVALSGCTGKEPAEMVSTAQSHIAANEFNAAAIELKNAVKAAPNNPSYRKLLADVYLQQGLLDAAEKEYLKALDNGASDAQVLPKLAQTLFYKADFQQATEIELTNTQGFDREVAELNLYKAVSAAGLNDNDAAIEFLTIASSVDTQSRFSRLANIALEQASDPKMAVENVDALISQLTSDFDLAYLLKGHFASSTQQFDVAVQAYQAFNKAQPSIMLGRMYYAIALIRDEQFVEASKVAKQITKVAPNQPLANHIIAESQYKLKNFEDAHLSAELAIQNGIDSADTRLIAGLSAFNLEKYEVANQHFSAIRSQIPANHPARQAMLATALKIGNIDEIQSSLMDLNLDELNPELVNATSLELFKSGRTAAAQKLLEHNSKLDLNDPIALSQLGVLKISTQDMSGIEDIEEALALDPTSIPLYLTLGSAYIREGEFDKAEGLIPAFVEASPDTVEPYNYAALVYLKSNKIDLAKQSLDKAKKIDGTNKMSLMFEINTNLKAGEYDIALANAKIILNDDPVYMPALRAGVVAASYAEDRQTIEALLQNAIEASPTVQPILLKAQYLNLVNDYEGALEALSSIQSESNAPELYWLVKSAAEYKINGGGAALAVLEQWTQMQPRNIVAWNRLITFLDTNQRTKDASLTAQRALRAFPNDANLKLIVAYYDSLGGDANRASRLIKEIGDDHSNPALINLINSQIALSNKKYSQALNYAKASYELKPTFNAARLSYVLIKEEESKQAAIAFAETHLKELNGDNALRFILANEYISIDKSAAMTHYEFLLVNMPPNLVVMNNLAFLLSESGQLDKAKVIAERAVSSFPDNANLLDTLGMIEFKMGNKNDALELLRKASKIAPQNEAIKKNLLKVKNS